MEANLQFLKLSIEKLEKKMDNLEKLIKDIQNYNQQILATLRDQIKQKIPVSGTEDLRVSIDSLTEQFSKIKTEKKISTTKTKNFLTYNNEEVKKHLKI